MIRLEDRSAVLHEGIWAKDVSIERYRQVEESYIVYDIKVVTINNAVIKLSRRYSDFETMYDSLIAETPNEYLAIPHLPPKTMFKSLDNDYFLHLRMDALDYFLKCVLLNPYTAESEAVKWFMHKL